MRNLKIASFVFATSLVFVSCGSDSKNAQELNAVGLKNFSFKDNVLNLEFSEKLGDLNAENIKLSQGKQNFALEIQTSQNPKISIKVPNGLNFGQHELSLRGLKTAAGLAIKDIDKSFTTSQSKVIQTAQITCYDNANSLISCSDNAAKGQDGYYALKNLGIKRSFTRQGDFLVDNATNLKWQDSNVEKINIAELTEIQIQRKCAPLNAFIPTLEQIRSTIDYSLTDNSTDKYPIQFADFKEKISGLFTYKDNFLDSIEANFAYYFNVYRVMQDSYIRCVQPLSNYPAKQECKKNAIGTIECKDTMLEWHEYKEKKRIIGDPEQKTWNDAISYCNNLNINGKNDWRLPNIHEAQSIISNTKRNTRGYNIINSLDVFEPFSATWTSTTFAPDPTMAWIVVYQAQWSPTSPEVKNKQKGNFRCVRTMN